MPRVKVVVLERTAWGMSFQVQCPVCTEYRPQWIGHPRAMDQARAHAMSKAHHRMVRDGDQ
jgi:hypothetical protein